MENLPKILLQELQGINGFDQPAFLSAHNEPAPVSVRINNRKDIGLFAENEQIPWCKDGVYLPQRPVFTLDPAYHAGAYYVQEASSMFLDHLLRNIIGDRKGLRVLDLCAAPGGKSTLIASILDKESLLVSNDVIRSRAAILDENMTRWGYMNTWVTSNDPRDFTKLTGYFDIIVVDAPCSGSGLWRKDARSLNEWSEANVQLCGERQQRILADIWPALKEDGHLVYATCSYSPREDEQVLDWLADEYKVTSMPVTVKEEWGITPVTSPNGMAGYRFFPDKVKGEGFFIAALQKKEESETLYLPRFKSAHDKKIKEQAAYLLQDPEQLYIQTDKEFFSALHPAHEADMQLLQKAVYLRKTGLKLGKPAGKDWLPEQEVALGIDANVNLPSISVTRDQALHFLKREDMGMQDMPKGWQLIRYNGLGLGWVKSLGNRVNNYLPKNWRIRMDLPDES